MTIVSEIDEIADRAGLTDLAAVDGSLGTQGMMGSLKSFTTLSFIKDGVYFNTALNVIVITKAGTVLDGMNFSGVAVNVQASNVTFKHCYFDATKGNYAINAFPSAKNLTIENSTFDGKKVDRADYVDFIYSSAENTVIKNNEFLNAPNDVISIQSGTISGNYISGGGYASGAHSDAIWIGKTIGPIVIEDNVIDWRTPSDAKVATNNAIRITGELGNVDNVVVENNVILGGSATVLVSDGATQTHDAASVGTVTNVQVVGNVIDYGMYFNLYPTDRPDDLVYDDNIHASGAAATPGSEAAGLVVDVTTLNQIYATTSTPNVSGTTGSDYLVGTAANNSLVAGGGDDVIYGGAGRDYLTGGAGKNTFVYDSVLNSGVDFIYDFKHGVDKISLLGLDGAPTSLAGWQWVGAQSFTGHEWQLRVAQSGTNTVIQVDVDGDMKADFEIQLKGIVNITTSDFLLVDASKQPAPVVPNVAPVITDGMPLQMSSVARVADGGVLLVTDANDRDILTSSISAQTVSLTGADGNDLTSSLYARELAELKSAFTATTGALGSKSGLITWSYDMDDVSFLGEGEMAKIVTTIQVDDGAGGQTTKDVEVVVVGANDAAEFTGALTVQMEETVNSTGSSAISRRSGDIAFRDVDTRDAHTVSVQQVDGTKNLGNFAAVLGTDSTGSGNGTISWSFDINDRLIDYLGEGETRDQQYVVSITDKFGAQTTETVTLSIVGKNDAAVVGGVTTGTLWEGLSTNLYTTRTLTFADVDLTDKLMLSVGKQDVTYANAGGKDITSMLSAAQIADITSGFSLSATELGSNSGKANWSYEILSDKLDFLGQNDTVTLTTTVIVDDGHDLVKKNVVMSLRGINDGPEFLSINAGDKAVSATIDELEGVSKNSSMHYASGSVGFNDVDLSDSHNVRVISTEKGYLGTFTASVSEDSTGGETGEVTWSYQVADSVLDRLKEGQSITQTYSLRLGDGKSGYDWQDVTITLNGDADQFFMTGLKRKDLRSFGDGDMINIKGSRFGNLEAGDLDDSYFTQRRSADSLDHGQFFQDASHRHLFWDADGAGRGHAVAIARFGSATDLDVNDLWVY